MIKVEFLNAVNAYNSIPDNAFKLWHEVEALYAEPSRHYHTIAHLENLNNELLAVTASFSNWNIVVFAIVYHDIIYKATKTNNEEKSAELAAQRLKGIALPPALIIRCHDFIMATKRHEPVDGEIDLFTDADLSILGSAADSYRLYTEQVRREYAVYPDLLYKPGRKSITSFSRNGTHIQDCLLQRQI